MPTQLLVQLRILFVLGLVTTACSGRVVPSSEADSASPVVDTSPAVDSSTSATDTRTGCVPGESECREVTVCPGGCRLCRYCQADGTWSPEDGDDCHFRCMDTGVATPDADAIAEPKDADAELSCANLDAKLNEYIAAHDSCATIDDCMAFGGAGTCDCARTYGAPSGNGIRKDAAAGLAPFGAKFGECTDAPKICDAAPGILSCTDGHCRVSWRSCLTSDTGGGS